MPAPEDPIEAVSQRLRGFLDEKIAESTVVDPDAEEFARIGAGTVSGGKRMRAAFCLWGWRACAKDFSSGEYPASVISVAASLEIFQSAALVHDDIIDNSDTRRGHPAAHRALETAHRARAWSGDAATHGRSSAILLGDLLVAWSDDLLEAGLDDLPSENARAARAAYAQMRRDVTIGQYLDIAAESAFADTPDSQRLERALHIASFKSARYSVQQPLLIGAAMAGAEERQIVALRDFGHDVGVAFQLRDDVLGVFGSPEVTGKPAGDDLREGKRTALIALTLQELPVASARTVEELLGDPELTDEQVSILQETIRASGALQRIEDLISEYSRRADHALVGAPLAHETVGALRDLARRSVQRSA